MGGLRGATRGSAVFGYDVLRGGVERLEKKSLLRLLGGGFGDLIDELQIGWYEIGFETLPAQAKYGRGIEAAPVNRHDRGDDVFLTRNAVGRSHPVDEHVIDVWVLRKFLFDEGWIDEISVVTGPAPFALHEKEPAVVIAIADVAHA